MLKIEGFALEESGPSTSLTLPFGERQRSRLRTRLDSGEEVALLLPRGRPLRGGDLLLAEDGRVVRVRAAPERVSTVRAACARSLLRAAYHLGNRHVPLEVDAEYLRYAHDHVLDGMVQGLGLEVAIEEAPFEPEAGAYAHGHADGDSHGPHRHAHGRDSDGPAHTHAQADDSRGAHGETRARSRHS